MKTYNIYEAKTNFSKLIDQVEQGNVLVIAKNGKPIADLTPHKLKKNKIKFGAWGSDARVMIPDDFDDPDPEIFKLFDKSRIFPDGPA